MDLNRFNIDEDVSVKFDYFEKFNVGLNHNCLKLITEKNRDKPEPQ